MINLHGLLLLLLSIVSLSTGIRLHGLRCSAGTRTELRIQGCAQQPCILQKGERLPFELQFAFQYPTTPAKVSYKAVTFAYPVPTPAQGLYLAWGECDRDLGGFQCPLHSGTAYTIKSNLYIDPENVCKSSGSGCERQFDNGTELIKTRWDFFISAPDHQDQKSSYCTFELAFNAVNNV